MIALVTCLYHNIQQYIRKGIVKKKGGGGMSLDLNIFDLRNNLGLLENLVNKGI